MQPRARIQPRARTRRQDETTVEALRAALDGYQQGAWSMVEASVLAQVQGPWPCSRLRKTLSWVVALFF